MKNRDIGLYLDDILQSIERIEQSARGLTKEEFDNNIDIQDAVVRRIEIIGEAAKQIQVEFKEMHSEIPWRKITGTRDIFIHDYMEVNFDRVWNIIRKDLPILKDQIEKLAAKKSSEG